jgi:hypothetical protein
MTNAQLYLAIGVPMVVNTVMLVGFYVLLNARISDVGTSLTARMEAGFKAVEAQFQAVNTRFDDMRDLWRAELRRVEEVLDARLKHLEER